MSEQVLKNQEVKKKSKMPEIELFRFWGSFVVAAGHFMLSTIVMPTVNNPLDAFLGINIYNLIIIQAVPIFLIFAGYFALVGPTGEGQFSKTLKKTIHLIGLYFFWLTIFYVINLLLNGGLFTGSISELFKVYFGDIANFYHGTVESTLLGKGIYPVLQSPLWYMFFYIGLIFVSPMFRPFFKEENVKAIRWILIVGIIAGYIGTNLKMFAGYIPNEAWSNALPSFTLFDLDRVINPAIWFFFFGGWIRVDKGLSDWFRNRRSWVMLLIWVVTLAFSLFAYATALDFMAQGTSRVTGLYESVFMFPTVMALFAFFYSLHGKIDEEGKLGKFVTKNGYKTMGIYILHPLVLCVLGNLIGVENFRNMFYATYDKFGGFVQMLLALGVGVIAYVCCYFFVTAVYKIPGIKRVL